MLQRIIIQLIEYLPLQQGLRHTRPEDFSNRGKDLIEYLPLQQGLRHSFGRLRLLQTLSHRVSSITTRIKTSQRKRKSKYLTSHRVSSITTRIKTLRKSDL